MKKQIASFLVATILIVNTFSITSVFASERKVNEEPVKTSVETLKQKNILSDEQVKIADKYISFDKFTKSFKINEIGLKKAVSSEIYEAVLKQVQITNITIKDALKAKDPRIALKVVDTNNEVTTIQYKKYRAWGKNHIEFHWNYARIYIDAGNLRLAARVGLVVGSKYYAPAAVISSILTILNIDITKSINHGIWFDYNYFFKFQGKCGLQ